MAERKSDDPLIGKTVATYRVERMLGKGGMSHVYLATDENLDREVAVKVITLERDRAKELMKRFKREARVIGKLDKHPNIITIYYYGEDPEMGRQFFAMELIKGETLTQRMGRLKRKEQYMPFPELIQIMKQVASALDYAHEQGVIHRDIKPSNVMIEKDSGRAILMDFGLVRDIVNESTLGTAFGTPRYIAPEQAISSQQAVPQSDIYGLGIILFEILTGQVPFDDESAMSLALSHITNPPPPPKELRPDLPDAASKVILKALEKEPEKRYKSATEMINALSDALGIASDAVVPAEVKAKQEAVEHDADTAADVPAKMPPVPPTPPPSGAAKIPSPEPQGKQGKSTSGSTRKEKSGKAKSDSNRMPLYIGIIVVVLLLAVAGFVLLGGGDDDGETASRQGDLRLVYDSQKMIIHNRSDGPLDLNGFIFVSPDYEAYYTSRLFGQTTLGEFVAGRCIHIGFEGDFEDRPDFCRETNAIQTREIPNLRKDQDGFFWLWDSDISSYDEFYVVKAEDSNVTNFEDAQIVQICQVARGECYVSWENPPDEVPTPRPLPTVEDTTPDGATLELVYNDENMIIRNVGSQVLDLNGFVLMTEDGRYYESRQFGNTSTLPNFVPERCIHLGFEGDFDDQPEFCTEADAPTRQVNHVNKADGNFYWVWNSELNTEGTFQVTMHSSSDVSAPFGDYEVLATCTVAEGQCYVSWTKLAEN